MSKKYFILFWFLILNSSNLLIFSKDFHTDNGPLKSLKYIDLNKKLVPNEYSNNLSNLLNNTLEYIAENIENTTKNKNKSLEAAKIYSDKQLNNDGYIIAEGDVLVIYKNMILISDKLEYNSDKKSLIIQGHINFKSNAQFLEASEIEYDLKNKTGFIKDAYGSVNFKTLNNIASKEDLQINISEFKNLDKSIRNVKPENTSTIGIREFGVGNEEKSSLQENLPQTLEADFNEMSNWRFLSKRIEIKDNLWTAEKLLLTNDPFNDPQLIINNKKFSASDKKGEFLVKSKWSTIELDNFLKIPTGPKRYNIEEDNQIRWGIGYDENSKDGLFINRNADTILIDEDKTQLDLKKVFFLQRAFLGKTKSYSKKNDSVLGKKIEQDAKISDFFGLEADLKSKLFDFDFYSNFELNSLDFEKFKKILSVDSELSKIIYEDKKDDMQKTTSLSIFGKYREKLWNSSFDEEFEILSSYGTKIEKINFWKRNKVNKSSKIEIGYGNYQAGKIEDITAAIDRKRLNISLIRNHNYPIWVPEVDEFITNKNKYSPNVIPKGIRFFAQTKADFYRYDDQDFQNIYTLRAGPEFTLGEFKNKYLDYTKFRILGKKKIAKGRSPFKFDQANDENSIELMLKQQLIGPLTFKLSTEYNLDENSSKYNKFHKKKYEITWNRRAYNLSAYYAEDKKTGGITFKIHSFNFDGSGESFKEF